jgi:hypothetical protein
MVFYFGVDEVSVLECDAALMGVFSSVSKSIVVYSGLICKGLKAHYKWVSNESTSCLDMLGIKYPMMQCHIPEPISQR